MAERIADQEENARSNRDKFYMNGMCATQISDYLLGNDRTWLTDSEGDGIVYMMNSHLNAIDEYEEDWDEELLEHFVEEGRRPIYLQVFGSRTDSALRNSTSSLSSGSVLPSTIQTSDSLKMQVTGEYEDDDFDFEPIRNHEEMQTRCFICLEDLVDVDDVVSVKGCQHMFCRECLGHYISYKSRDSSLLYHRITLVHREAEQTLRIENVDAYGIPCPAKQCQHIMLINEMIPVADQEAIDTFLRMSEVHRTNQAELDAQAADDIDSDGGLYRCKHCHCTTIHRILRSGRQQCSRCKFVSCPKCNQRHPTYFICDADEPKMNIVLSRCPKCKSPVEKSDGCDHMTCRCGAHFCWRCGKQSSGQFVYNHLDQCKSNLTRRRPKLNVKMRNFR
ncbi:ATP dependent helicase [Planoprotostelium fungivorum]|uniref:ATP dependent helicase n=1 Tax=Planoprotostelium fungivorum TaxID=1890364 RepID=A0A2P6NBK4_9EUKA|nr:ATP dependent helicase [Planoprotostelium fungivorum]